MPGPADRREKGALSQTLRVCRAVSWGGAHPADGDPVRRCAPEQAGSALPHPPCPAGPGLPDREGRPALPNPPRPPCAGGSRPQPAPPASPLHEALGAGPRWARRRPRRGRRPHPPSPPGSGCRCARPARPRSPVAKERSPLGSPLPWGMAGAAPERQALRPPQALSSRGAGTPLREGLTQPPGWRGAAARAAGAWRDRPVTTLPSGTLHLSGEDAPAPAGPPPLSPSPAAG